MTSGYLAIIIKSVRSEIMKRKVLEKYGYDHNGKLDYRKPIYLDYDLDDKIKYYGKRRIDSSLSKE